ncbi:MAG: hypothetical protein RQ867_04905 [Mariprofundaceae bacterium]|nr:hypothetical protein [Mariprofundaceae bacterium]
MKQSIVDHVTGSDRGNHGALDTHKLSPAAARLATSVMAACIKPGGGIMSKIFRHPVVLLGIGAAAGFYIHKYRKEIIASAGKYTDLGKDYVLQQKESLEDLAAEAREIEETASKPAKKKGPETA